MVCLRKFRADLAQGPSAVVALEFVLRRLEER